MSENALPEWTGEAGEIVTLLDENGAAVRFDHLLTFQHEGTAYVALLPVDTVENVGEDEVIILRIAPGEGDETDRYLPVEDDTLLDKLFALFLELFDEMLDEEENAD